MAEKWVIKQARQDVEDAKRALALARETLSKVAISDAQEQLKEKQAVLDRLTSENDQQAGRAEKRWLGDHYAKLGPMVADLVKQDPELANLFQRAVREEWDQPRFDYELKNNTKWWNSKSAPWQKAFALEFGSSDAEWKRQMDLAGSAVDKMASDYGVTLDATQRERLSRAFHYRGWAEDQASMQSFFAQRATRQPQSTAAQFNNVTQLTSELSAFAKDFGISYGSDWLQATALKLLDPKSGVTMNKIIQEMGAAAESRYPAFKGKLGYGGGEADGDFTTLREAAGDYVGIASSLLEVQDRDIDLSDGLFRQAFNAGDGSDKKMMSLYDFENAVRNDPRWAKTKNAQDSASKKVNDILSMFGMIG